MTAAATDRGPTESGAVELLAAHRPRKRWRFDLQGLVGSGDRIALFTVPFLLAGLALRARYPSRLAVDASSKPARAASLVGLGFGLAAWAWSVGLILSKVPRGELITSGPYAVVKHPLYTSVALLVLPSAGLLRGSWLGAIVGGGLYLASRRFGPSEEAELAREFDGAWEAYDRSVMLRWV